MLETTDCLTTTVNNIIENVIKEILSSQFNDTETALQSFPSFLVQLDETGQVCIADESRMWSVLVDQYKNDIEGMRNALKSVFELYESNYILCKSGSNYIYYYVFAWFSVIRAEATSRASAIASTVEGATHTGPVIHFCGCDINVSNLGDHPIENLMLFHDITRRVSDLVDSRNYPALAGLVGDTLGTKRVVQFTDSIRIELRGAKCTLTDRDLFYTIDNNDRYDTSFDFFKRELAFEVYCESKL